MKPLAVVLHGAGGVRGGEMVGAILQEYIIILLVIFTMNLPCTTNIT
jgi:hypothetical protein